MTNNKIKLNKKLFTMRNQSGFVALFAVLLSMLIFAMALGITSTAFKESLLSIQSKEGHLALFSADSGVECALYGDLTMLGFGDQTNSPNTTFECVGANGNVGELDTLNFVGLNSPFEFTLDLSDDSCVTVKVDKNFQVPNADGSATISHTKIDSFGYNVACPQVGNPDNLRKVERALRVMYPN